MISIVFEPHAPTTDNEKSLSSGWNDDDLSEIGVKRAKELGLRRNLDDFDAIFTSDLKRAYQTATLAFKVQPKKLHIDWRLRECDYGNLTKHPTEEVNSEKIKRITKPFPNGESYEQTLARMKSFLEDLLSFYDGKHILIIGHRATHYGLDRWINGIPIEEELKIPFKWQPGWEYEFSMVHE